ncbi:MAG: hypothetical protein Q9181_006299 [Wetmoreana brouardii]
MAQCRFAPLDYPSALHSQGLHALFSYFQIPTEYIAERAHSVTHSFGWHTETDSTYGEFDYIRAVSVIHNVAVCWLHTLCKNVELRQDEHGALVIQDPRGPPYSKLSQDDGTWFRSGIFLRWKRPSSGASEDSAVDLIIFSPPPSLRQNLERLVTRSDWVQALEDPFCLLVVILDDLFRQLETTIGRVLAILRMIERMVLESANSKVAQSPFNFVAIHNVAKHIIHVKESSSATLLMAHQISEQHRQIMTQPEQSHEYKLTQGVQGLLQHKLTLLENCQMKAQSMDSRAQNMINLGVCGSQFFNFDDETHRTLVSKDFRYFWATTLPLTALMFVVYAIWRQLKGNDMRNWGGILEFRRHWQPSFTQKQA